MKVKSPESLRSWRKHRRFSQQQLADLARCSQNMISLLELGRERTLTASLAVDIAAWLEVPWDQLFEAGELEVVPGIASSIDFAGKTSTPSVRRQSRKVSA